MMVKFLMCAGLPWPDLRQSARANDHQVADVSWLYFLPHFEIAGKYNCKQMSVLCTRIQNMMRPEVKSWYDALRIASWSEKIGGKMPWDQTQEKANNLIKPFMQAGEEELLGECVHRLNGIKEVESRMAHLLGGEPSKESAGTRVELDDIKAVVLKLKEADLGNSFDAFCARKSNRFIGAEEEGRTRSGQVPDVGGPARPWKHVAEVRESKDLRYYVKEALMDAPEVLPFYE